MTRTGPAVLTAVVVLIAASPAAADTFTVTNTNDPGPGSLRQAMIDANAHPGADVIAFAPGVSGTILLTQGELSIQSEMEIRGPGPTALTVSGNNRSRVFNISSQPPGRATISGLTIANGLLHGDDGGSAGDSGASPSGGGILNQGTLTLDDVQVSGNRLEGGNGAGGNRIHSGGSGGNAFGGGIASYGTLILANTLVAGNTAQGGFGGDAPSTVTLHAGEGGSAHGGGIWAQGRFTASNVRVAGNTASGGEGGNSIPDFSRGRRGGEGNGAGIRLAVDPALPGEASITDSTIEANTARGGPGPYGGWAHGAGLWTEHDVAIEGTTIGNNQAIGADGDETEPRPQEVQGGGVYNFRSSLEIEESTVHDNLVRGGNRHNEFSTIAGGGIENVAGGFLVLTNSTVTGNSAEVGGGVDNRDKTAVITASTLAGNSATNAGANFANFQPLNGAAFGGTIVALPRGAAPSCANGQYTFSYGYNLDQGNGCGFGTATDIRNTNPQLGELKQNGGPTRTMAITKSSPALDQSARQGLVSDQRGLTRPVSFGVQRPTGGDGSDIGAFELQGGTTGEEPSCGGDKATIIAANTGEAHGTKRADVIAGTDRGDDIVARRAGDTLCGRDGADGLHGQRGADVIRAGRGADSVRGGPGGDSIHAQRGRNRIVCGSGFDHVVTNRSSSVAADCERVRRR